MAVRQRVTVPFTGHVIRVSQGVTEGIRHGRFWMPREAQLQARVLPRVASSGRLRD